MYIEQWEDGRGNHPVEEFIIQQPSKAQAKIAWTIGLLESQGMDLLRTKHMERLHGYKPTLYELKIYIMRKFYRIFFVVSDNTAWFLHAFAKKTNETPRKDIEIAVDRGKEIIQ
ncbi:MAG TPA: type II toxin-antitoxin system RelE/ParE family toxin [Candidatus Paceibacterota bacterium]